MNYNPIDPPRKLNFVPPRLCGKRRVVTALPPSFSRQLEFCATTRRVAFFLSREYHAAVVHAPRERG